MHIHVIARSEATKQSSFLSSSKLDCFANARNDEQMFHPDPRLAAP
jgi:hypothetical protein